MRARAIIIASRYSYAPFHSKVISATADEAAHVLDGLLHHAADLAITDHHTDGGGVSDHVYALCHLLGFRFAPRIPNIGERRLHLFAGQTPGPSIAPFVAGRIESPDERRCATRELNKGEAENALKRAIFFHRVGRLRDYGLQAQTHRASAVNVVVGAIVLWNTTHLQAALAALAKAGRPVLNEHLAHLSPLGWQHINLTGDYLWSERAHDDRLRPLRPGALMRDRTGP